MASTQLLVVIMIISIVGILGLTFFLIRYDDIVFKYRKEDDDSAPVFIQGPENETFLSPTTNAYNKYKYRCDDINVLCQSPWKCVNGVCQACTEVETVTECSNNICTEMDKCKGSIDDVFPKLNVGTTTTS
jgi:hypothetical protein